MRLADVCSGTINSNLLIGYRKSGTETLGLEKGPRILGWDPRVGS